MKSLYHGQPEIVSVRPLRYTNPIRKISVEGAVLDIDDKERTLSKSGTSSHITVNPDWKPHLEKGIEKAFLIQSNKNEILILLKVKGGDSDE